MSKKAIVFGEVCFRNFVSFGKKLTTVNLNNPGSTLIQGNNGDGKSQPLYSKIRTPTGWIRMGDVSIGDVISAPDGTTTTIIGVFPQGYTDTYKLTFSDNRSTHTCSEHIWQTNLGIISTKSMMDAIGNGDTVTIPVATHPTIPPAQLCVAPFLLGSDPTTDYIPREYLDVTSYDQKVELIHGLLSISGDDTYVTNSLQLCNDIRELVRAIGGEVGVVCHNGNYTLTINYYTEIGGIELVSVERIGDQLTQCIQVDHPDHLYITDDYIVTHNTVLLNAISYVLFDKAISDISKDDLVNNINKKDMMVGITFTVGKFNYEVKRYRKTKSGQAGNYVQLYRDGKDITPDSVTNTNIAIEKILGYTYDIFVYVIAFSATKVPFLDLPQRSAHGINQTDIIELLFDITTLSEKAIILKDKIKDSEQSLKINKIKIDQLEQEHARHSGLIVTAQRRVDMWGQTQQQSIAELQSKIDGVGGIDIDAEKVLHTSMIDLQGKIRDIQQTYNATDASHGALVRLVDGASRELTQLHDDKCPYCKQEFESTETKISECNAVIADNQPTIGKLADQLVTLGGEWDQYAENLKVIKSSISVQNIDELIKLKENEQEYTQAISILSSDINPHIEAMDELSGIELEPINYEVINELSTLIDHQKFLLKLLTKKDSFVRKALLRKNLPYLNTCLSEHLIELGLPHKVEFTHELKAEISRFGRRLGFGNLSAGQRARVNIALSFAFRDVLEKMHSKISICMIDELLDVGLDTNGIIAASRMLKHRARVDGISMFIISHKEEVTQTFDRAIHVKLVSGFSEISKGPIIK